MSNAFLKRDLKYLGFLPDERMLICLDFLLV